MSWFLPSTFHFKNLFMGGEESSNSEELSLVYSKGNPTARNWFISCTETHLPKNGQRNRLSINRKISTLPFSSPRFWSVSPIRSSQQPKKSIIIPMKLSPIIIKMKLKTYAGPTVPLA